MTALPQSRTVRRRCKLSGDTNWRRKLKRRRRRRRKRRRRRNIAVEETIIVQTATDPDLARETEEPGGDLTPSLTPVRREKGGTRRGGKRKRKTRNGKEVEVEVEAEAEAEAEVDREDEFGRLINH